MMIAGPGRPVGDRAGRRYRFAAILQEQLQEDAGDGTEALTSMNDAERPHETAAVERPGDQGAGLDLAAQRRFGQQGHTGADGDGLLDVLNVVELARHLDSSPLFAQ